MPFKPALLYILAVIFSPGTPSAYSQNREATCQDDFPRIVTVLWTFHKKPILLPGNQGYTLSSTDYKDILMNNCTPQVQDTLLRHGGVGLAVHPATESICRRSGTGEGEVYCVSNNYEGMSMLVSDRESYTVIPKAKTGTQKDKFLTFDPFGMNLYWSTRTYSGIYVTNVKTKASKLLFRLHYQISNFALDGKNGIFFGSYDWRRERKILDGKKVGTILRAVHDGVTWQKEEIPTPGSDVHELTLDPQNEHVYWSRETEITRMNYQGNEMTSYSLHPDQLTRGGIINPTLRFFEDYLYYFQGNKSSGFVLSKLDWNTKEQVQLSIPIPLGSDNITAWTVHGMEIYQNGSKQVESNPCDLLNCTHLCLPVYHQGFQCDCPLGMKRGGEACIHEDRPALVYVYNTGKEKQMMEVKNSWENVINAQESSIFSKYGITTSADLQTKCYLTKIHKSGKPMLVLIHSTNDEAREVGNTTGNVHGRLIASSLTDSGGGQVYWVDASSKCIQSTDLTSGITSKFFCSARMDTDFVTLDLTNRLVFWRERYSGRLLRTDVGMNRTRVVLPDPEILFYGFYDGPEGPLICADPTTNQLFWIASHDKIKWSDYEGNIKGEFKSESIDAIPRIKHIQCADGRPYWLGRIDRIGEFIATLDVETRLDEMVLQVNRSTKLETFSLGSNNLSPNAFSQHDHCLQSPCSHFCVPESTSYKCFCPPDFTLVHDVLCLPADEISESSKELIMTMYDGSSVESLFFNATTPTNTSLIDIPIDNPNFPFSLHRETKTICWVSNTTLQCKRENGETKIIGETTAAQPLLVFNPAGDKIYWRVDNSTCFKVSSILTQQSFSFRCFEYEKNIEGPIAVDALKSALFWCDRDVKLKSLIGGNMLTLYERSTRTRGSECNGIAVDIVRELVFVLYGEYILSIPYPDGSNYDYGILGDRTGVMPPRRIARLPYGTARDLTYYNDALYWIGMDTQAGTEFVDFLSISDDTQNSENSYEIPQRLFESEMNFVINQFQPYHPVHMLYDPCAHSNCPGFCFPSRIRNVFWRFPHSSDFSDSIGYNQDCRCPDEYIPDIHTGACLKNLVTTEPTPTETQLTTLPSTFTSTNATCKLQCQCVE